MRPSHYNVELQPAMHRMRFHKPAAANADIYAQMKARTVGDIRPWLLNQRAVPSLVQVVLWVAQNFHRDPE